MNKSILIILLLLQNSALYAAPNKSDADRWLSDFRNAQDRTSDALFINHFDNRRKLTTEIENLVAQSENLFDKDQYRSCINAANWLNSYWSSAVWLMSSPASDTHVTLSSIINSTWETRHFYDDCRILILDIK